MWIPQKNVNRRRPQSNQPSSSQRPQTPQRIDFSFPKIFRILKRGHYQAIGSARNRFVGQFITIQYRTKSNTNLKLGITVSRKFGGAVQRNYFKRIVREAFRQNRHRLFQKMEIIVLPKKGAEKVTLTGVADDLIDLSKKMETRESAQYATTKSR